MSTLLTINMPPIGKARPRLGKRGVYMPSKYMQWKQKFGLLSRAQITNGPIGGKFHINICICTKSGLMRSDIDNVAGSILDALQDAKVIGNDRDCVNLSINITQGKIPMIIVALTEHKP